MQNVIACKRSSDGTSAARILRPLASEQWCRSRRPCKSPARSGSGVAELDRAFAEATAAIGRGSAQCDHHDRRTLRRLRDAATRASLASPRSWRGCLRPAARSFYAGRAGFVEASRDVAAHAADIASANWHASAALAGLSRARGACSSTWARRRRISSRLPEGEPANLGYHRRRAPRPWRAGLYRPRARPFLMAGPKLRAVRRPMDAA